VARSGFHVTVEKDNSAAVMRHLDGNISLALDAMGVKGVNLILWQMRQGYGKPIRQTGDLQRDVQYAVEGNELIWGNTLDYSIFVHEGTRKMQARHYMRDALFSRNNIEKLITIGDTYLSRGFK
jgi:hypothetical protein